MTIRLVRLCAQFDKFDLCADRIYIGDRSRRDNKDRRELLRDSLNTKWNVNILEPREGIGGHCLAKDTKMFIESSRKMKSKILSAAMEVDQDYRRFRGVGESLK